MTRLPALWPALAFAVLLVVGCAGSPENPRISPDDEVQLYERHLEQQPGDIASWVRLAQLYINYDGDRLRARALAQQCIDANPAVPDAWLAAAQIQVMTGGNRGQAREYVERYLELRPRDERGYLLLADLERDDPEAALAALDRGLNLMMSVLAEQPGPPPGADPLPPDHPAMRPRVAVLRLAAAKSQFLALQARYDDALAELEGVLDNKDIGDVPGTWQLGDLAARYEVNAALREGGDPRRLGTARQRMDALLVREPSQPTVIQTWAWLMLVAGLTDDAIRGLTGQLDRTETPEARQVIYLNLGYAEVLRGQPDAALSLTERALESDRSLTAAMLLRYQLLRVLGEAEKAAEAAERMAEQRVAVFEVPGRLETLQAMFRGVFAQRFFLKERAREQFRRAWDLEPDVAWGALALAQLAQEREDWDRAIFWFSKTLDQRELAPEVHCNIADCYLVMRDYRNAIRHYDDALALVPTNARAMRGKERALARRDAADEPAESGVPAPGNGDGGEPAVGGSAGG